MTFLLTRLLAVCVLFTIAGCSGDKRKAAQKTLQQVGTTTLRREAATFYKQLFVAPTGQYFLPKPDQWPPSFGRFEPLRVRAYADGFSLALRDTRDGEEGLYVVPFGMDKTPREGRNVVFEKIDEGLYGILSTSEPGLEEEKSCPLAHPAAMHFAGSLLTLPNTAP